MGNTESTLPNPNFEYTPLPSPRHIRLLTIHSTLLNFVTTTTPLKLSLQLHDLDTKGPSTLRFNVLSYTWALPLRPSNTVNLGPEPSAPSYGPTHTIELDGHPFTVSQNLFDALIRLRHALTEPIWIDALCINQADLAERAAQVTLMGTIYARAAQTLVWLGQDEDDLPAALRVVQEVSPLLKTYFTAGRFDARVDQLVAPGLLARIRFAGSMGEWLDLWRGFARFVRRRRYFTRGWIIQELALSRDVTVLCGSSCVVPWEEMGELAGFLSKSGWEAQVAAIAARGDGLEAGRPARSVGDEIIRLRMFREMCVFFALERQLEDPVLWAWMEKNELSVGGREEVLPVPVYIQGLRKVVKNAMGAEEEREKWIALLAYLVFRIRGYQLSDKRDHIYAILGLVQAWMPLPKGMDMPVTVDYTISAEEVFRKLAVLLFKELPALLVLSLVEDRGRRTIKGYPETPSWVPDFSAALCPPPFAFLGNGAHFFACGIQGMKRGDEVFKEIDTEEKVLTLKGMKLGVVRRTCMEQASLLRSRWLQSILDLAIMIPQPYFHLQSSSSSNNQDGGGSSGNGNSSGVHRTHDRIDILWRTMIADHGPQFEEETKYPAPPELRESFLACLLYWLSFRLSQEEPESRGYNEFMGAHLGLDVLSSNGSGLARTFGSGQRRNRTITLDTVAYIAARTRGTIQNLGVGEEYNDDSELARDAVLFGTVLDPFLYNRGLFITTMGHFGLGPMSMKEKDEVWIAEGSHAPLVLREVDGSNVGGLEDGDRAYMLVGESYVHGFMNGEGVEGRERAWERVRLV